MLPILLNALHYGHKWKMLKRQKSQPVYYSLNLLRMV